MKRFFRFDNYKASNNVVIEMMKARLPSPKNMAALLALALFPHFFCSELEDSPATFNEGLKLAAELVPARAQSRIGALGVILFFVVISHQEETTPPDSEPERDETDGADETGDMAEDSDWAEDVAVNQAMVGGIIGPVRARKYLAAVKDLFRFLGHHVQPEEPDVLFDNLRSDITNYAAKARVKAEGTT